MDGVRIEGIGEGKSGEYSLKLSFPFF